MAVSGTAKEYGQYLNDFLNISALNRPTRGSLNLTDPKSNKESTLSPLIDIVTVLVPWFVISTDTISGVMKTKGYSSELCFIVKSRVSH